MSAEPGTPDQELTELPADLLFWRDRAARGELAPWDRFGIRFLADGELPRVLDLPDLPEPEPTPENLEAAKLRAEAEATRLTAALVTWVAEDGEGRGIGYWHTADRVPLGKAEIVLAGTNADFEHIAGATLTEALCVECGAWEDETVAPLIGECRALGVAIDGETIDDFPYMESQRPSYFRSKRYDELMERFKQDVSDHRAAQLAAESAMPGVPVTGVLRSVLDVLGRPAEDESVEAAMALFGPPFERSEFEIGPVVRVYQVAADGHAQLIFEDGVFTSAMVWVRESAERGAYVSPAPLVDGVGPETTRDEILARFGTPARSTDASDRFRVDGGFVRFGYVDGRVEEITAMRTTPEA